MTTRGPRRQALTVLTLVVVLAMTLVLPWADGAGGPHGWTGAHAQAAARTATEDDAHSPLPVEVRVVAVTPTVLRLDEDLTVTVEMVNTGTTTIAEPRVSASIDRRRFTSRSALDRWRSADPSGPIGSPVLDVDLESPLAPDTVVRTTLLLPAASLNLRAGPASWGPRGLAVTVVDRADPARARQGIARTFALWFGVEEVSATRVSVLVPLVGPPVDPASDAWVPDLEELTAEGGRLRDVVSITGGVRGVSWAVDPWLALVTSSHAAPEPGDDGEPAPEPTAEPTREPTPEPTSKPSPTDSPSEQDQPGATAAPAAGSTDEPTPTPSRSAGGGEPGAPIRQDAVAGPSARAWGEVLGGATTNREVHLLPYLDADVTALAHADAGDLLDLARDRAVDALGQTDLPQGARVSLTWPAEERPDLRTAATAARTRAPLVLGPGSVPPLDDLIYTPTGRATIATADGEADALVADRRLSEALRSGLVPMGDPDRAEPEDGVRSVTQPLTAATAVQDLLAELAVITRERPSDPRHVLLTVGRDWHPADVAVPTAQLEALEAAPWVDLTPVSTLVGSPAPDVERAPLPEVEVARVEVDALALETVRDAVEDRRRLAAMAEEPDALLGDLELERLAPAGVAWRADANGRQELMRDSVARTEALRNAVGVLPGSDVNLISTSGEMRVRVANTLTQPVTVDVSLRLGDPRLRTDGPVRVTIPAAGEETVQIMLRAIQSADVPVGILVHTPEGVLVDDRTEVTVRVRAEWETIGTAVLGGLLALGLVLGVMRSIRRGRSKGRRAPPLADAGPDDLSPEDAAAGSAEGMRR